MSDLHRDAVSWLRDYGAEDVRIEQNGRRHPRLVFIWRGKKVIQPMAGSPSDINAIHSLTRQLKNRLGEPVVEVKHKKERTLEQMTEELKASAPQVDDALPRSYKGRISRYTRYTRFVIPEKLVDRFNKGFIVRPIGKDIWELSPSVTGLVPRRYDNYKIDEFILNVWSTNKDGTFGSSPAEYVVVDGKILASVASRNSINASISRSVVQRRFKKSAVQQAVKRPAIATVLESLVQDAAAIAHPVPVPVPAPLKSEPLSELLDTIASVENTTPYRLTKVRDEDGSSHWEWRAPRIVGKGRC
jgi:hypothetical protein